MSDDTLRTAVLALAAVTAVALAASALDATTFAESAASGGQGDGRPGGVAGDPPVETADVPLPLPWWVGSVAFALTALVVLFAALFERRRFLRYTASAVVGLLVVGVVLYVVSELFGGSPGAVGGNATNASRSGSGGGSPANPVGPAVPAVVALGLVAAGLVVAALGARVVGGDDAEAASAPEPTSLGAAAGRAADRIEHAETDADLDNAVYRAFYDLTASLDVSNPHSATPRDFADAAVESGMDADDVETLTGLFRAVRYGDREPTAAVEEAAVAALRRIEERRGGEP